MQFQANILLKALITCFVIPALEGARILIVLPLPFKSHAMTISVLVDELVDRGHEVTVMTSFPRKESIPNYHEIVIDSKLFVLPENYNLVEWAKLSSFRTMYDRWTILPGWVEAAMASEPVQRLISSTAQYDVIMGNFLTRQEAFLTLGHRFNAPLIEICTQHLPLSTASFVGNPYSFSYLPDYEIPYIERLSFVERLHNTVWGLYTVLGITWHELPKHEEIVKRHFHYPGIETRPTLGQLIRNISLILVNSHNSFYTPRPVAPNVIEIGGFHIKPPKPLPPDLQSFMDTALEGVVFVSFGTFIKAELFSTEQEQIFVSVFRALRLRVLWRWDNAEACANSSRISIRKWLPQQSILGHPNCVLYLTHGGLNSLIEAIHFGIPLIGIPFMIDQFHNVEYMQQRGIGLKLDFRNLTHDRLLKAMTTVLNGSSFRDRMKEQSRILRDQPQSPLERAVYWVEYVIRHKGAHHLKPASVHLPFYQYVLLDVVAVIVVALVVIIIVLWKVLKFLYSCCVKYQSQRPLKERCRKKTQ